MSKTPTSTAFHNYGMKKTFVLLLLQTCFLQNALSQNSVMHSRLTITSKEKNRVSIDSVYSYQLSAVDSSGKLFSFKVKNLSSWLRYDNASHIISGSPLKPGQYPIDIAVINPDTTVHQRFMLTVYDRATVNILCLGNSITNGTDKYNSYRRILWQLLHKNNYNIDMIGSWNSHHMGGPVPQPDFDMDHDGHSGWTAENVLNPPDWDKQRGNIRQWLQIYSPDIVLLELGTNEVFQCVAVADAIKNISTIVDVLRKKNAKVKIFLAQIPPLGQQWAPKKLCGNDIAYAQRVTVFNESIKLFAAKKNTVYSPVILVDQYSGVSPAKNMYDDIHPNESGEKIMAGKWFNAIRPYLKKLQE
ncbi:MAG: GDSL-type esterase/lipase family protein [Ferruginibacter sp.]